MVIFFPCSGYSYLICDHMRAVYLYISALENSCPLMAFPCATYKAFLAGQCLDCFNPFLLSCPRIGKCHPFGNLGQVQVLLVVTSVSPDFLWSRSLSNWIRKFTDRCSAYFHLEDGIWPSVSLPSPSILLPDAILALHTLFTHSPSSASPDSGPVGNIGIAQSRCPHSKTRCLP